MTTHAQDEVPEPTGPAAPEPVSADRETTAIDGRIPAALLHELANELGQLDGLSETDTEGGGRRGGD